MTITQNIQQCLNQSPEFDVMEPLGFWAALLICDANISSMLNVPNAQSDQPGPPVSGSTFSSFVSF
jgi:hypothetical protein